MIPTTNDTIDTIFENQTSTIAKDLKLNLTRFIEGGALTREESHLALLAASSTLEFDRLAAYATSQLQRFGLSPEEILEARESAAIVGMLNTYYRFRHFLHAPEEYRVAGLRMTALARPILGKECFEMLAFTVSVLNGCEACTQAHERTLKEAGISSEKIHDLARLAAVVKGVTALIKHRV